MTPPRSTRPIETVLRELAAEGAFAADAERIVNEHLDRVIEEELAKPLSPEPPSPEFRKLLDSVKLDEPATQPATAAEGATATGATAKWPGFHFGVLGAAAMEVAAEVTSAADQIINGFALSVFQQVPPRPAPTLNLGGPVAKPRLNNVGISITPPGAKISFELRFERDKKSQHSDEPDGAPRLMASALPGGPNPRDRGIIIQGHKMLLSWPSLPAPMELTSTSAGLFVRPGQIGITGPEIPLGEPLSIEITPVGQAEPYKIRLWDLDCEKLRHEGNLLVKTIGM